MRDRPNGHRGRGSRDFDPPGSIVLQLAIMVSYLADDLLRRFLDCGSGITLHLLTPSRSGVCHSTLLGPTGFGCSLMGVPNKVCTGSEMAGDAASAASNFCCRSIALGSNAI